MSRLSRSVSKNCDILEKSERRFEDIYGVLCSHGDKVMTEMSTMTRKLTHTYSDFKHDTEILARGIYYTLGESDRYVALHGENSYEWIVTFWAILMSGNKPYLVNLRQPTGFSAKILKTLDAAAVISTDSSRPNYERKLLIYGELLDFGKTKDDAPDVTFGNEFALSTSGTTLNEKICVYSGEHISMQILNTRGVIKKNKFIVSAYRGKIKMLAFLPLYHIFGFSAMYLWFSFFGATFVFLSSYDGENILRTVYYHDVTHIFAVPLLWHSVEKSLNRKLGELDEKTRKKFEKGKRLSLAVQNVCPRLGMALSKSLFRDVRYKLFGDAIRFCISGGSFIKGSTVELFNALGYPLCNGYGMSEIGITSVELDLRPKIKQRLSIGIPFDSVEYRIGEGNRLLVRGDSTCKRLIINGEDTPMPEWFDTGDVVREAADGRYYIEGRVSDIVFGDDGENLNPDLAEKVFELTDAKELSVLGNEDNSRLMLIVRIPEGLVATQKERLLDEISRANASLPTSYTVRDVKFTHDALIPKNGIKVSRAYLRRAIDEGKISFVDINKEEDRSMAYESAQSELRSALRALFAEALGVSEDEIRDDEHFMTGLGGTSLDYFTLLSLIDKTYGVRLDFESGDDFHYTLNDFLKILEEKIK
ncbi:MAG: hypothetical protein E7677_00245 [Ruminococcaceae bacterium]|nr:hypothetical protein [Oscillospiraceae bacterium]